MEEEKAISPKRSKAKSIKKLDDEVVNRIAAGEVVVRPSAALKELLENSIDAGSQNINVGCREGGLQMLQIQDDGHGIKVEDYPILWERFTTSKITKYQDLSVVSSFGFRGEALASISFVGKLEITSRTEDQDVAYKGYFENGMLVPGNGGHDASPIAWAGHVGTLIKANDLFYNNKQRKKSFNKKEEFVQIVDVVTNYAIHFWMVNFTCKQLDSTNWVAVSTVNIPKDGREVSEVRKEVIRRLHGGVSEGDMFVVKHEMPVFGVKVDALCTKANAKNTTKRNTMILFINNRLVKCDRIKKALDLAYHPYLPKGHQYFTYLSLQMNSKDIDINVHPTKKEVGFSNQDDIASALTALLDSHLTTQNSTITFGHPDTSVKAKSQTKKKAPRKSHTEKKLEKKDVETEDMDEELEVDIEDSQRQAAKTEQKSMVRVDHRDATLDHFLMHGKIDSELHRNKLKGREYGIQNPIVFMEKGEADEEMVETPDKIMNLATVVSWNLLSIRKLIYEFEHDIDDDYTQMWKNHAYVGLINYDQILIQYETAMLLVNIYPLLNEYIYQQTLYNFQNFGRFKLNPPLELKELLAAGLDYPDCNFCEKEHQDKDVLVDHYFKKLSNMGEMLDDYFKLTIEDGKLTSMPKIVKEIPPYIDYLPVFLVKLAADVDYVVEKNWFKQIWSLLGDYYAKFIYYYAANSENEDEDKRLESLEFILKNMVMPRLKRGLKIRSKFGTECDGTFTTITCLENLYKVFERCN
jgi:DNA mismatch repair protein MLH1